MAVPLGATLGVPGKDLPEDQQVALQRNHDADFPVEPIAVQTKHLSTSTDPHDEKHAAKAHSISSSSSGVVHSHDQQRQHDLEKGASTTITTANEEPSDPNIVDWDGPDDPANPLNWSSLKKFGNLFILSMMTFLTPLASSMFAPGVPQLMHEFNSSSTLLATFVVSVYVLGFAIGPLIVAPLSELYGRLAIYHTCNVGFIVFTVACAYAPNITAFIVFRFFQGCWGVAPLTIGGGTIVDMVPAERRGRIMSAWSLGPLIGPVIGPVAGGFLAGSVGWRWIFLVISIASGVVTLVAFVVLRESYPVTLLANKTKRLQKETGNMDLRSKLDLGLTPKALFIRSIMRPTKMLLFSPVCALMSLFMAVLYGFLYLLFTTFTYVFRDVYGFGASTVGLTYLGSGIGFFIGLGVMAFTSDSLLARLTAKNGGVMKPEYRLPQLVCAVPLLPIAFLIYGWTAEFHVHWIVPIFGTLILGIALNIAFMAVCTYLVDSFTIYAASAMAANTVLRSLFGGVIPLFGLQMYNKLGLGWGNSLLAFVALALCPIPWLFYVYGERLRTSKRFQVTF